MSSAAHPGPGDVKTIWTVTREYGHLAGAGGVKDVARQLGAALARSGRRVSVVLPLYGFMDPQKLGFSLAGLDFSVDISYAGEDRREPVRVWARRGRPMLYLIDSPRFREKRGVYTYTDAEDDGGLRRAGQGHYDYFAMNVLLQKASLALMTRLGERPDVIHCHDGHTALIPALIRETDGWLHYFHDTGCVVTIHNAGLGYHQEVDDLPFAKAVTGLPARVISTHLLDGKFDPLLCASSYAVLNTVSENYARELQETDDDRLTGWLGHALKQRGVILEGVTNGIDPADFDLKHARKLGLPAACLPGRAPDGIFSCKPACKKAVLADLAGGGFANLAQTGCIDERPGAPLFTFIGRLTAQKGVDKMIGAIKKILLLDPDFQILILGSGDRQWESELQGLAGAPGAAGRVCLLRGYDPIAANRVYAAGDFFIIPSRYEPCGLTDYYAQMFGSLPIVHHVGGLVKVVDGKTGFAYREHSDEALAGAMRRAARLFRDDPARVNAMGRAAIALIHERYTWDRVKDKYLKLYWKSIPHKGERQ